MAHTGKAKSAANTVIYLYGVTRDSGRTVAAAGVDGAARVEALPCSRFTCWISRAPRRAFADELNQNMQDLDWLAASSIRHQKAVAAIAANSDILPARFATVFLSLESLAAHIAEQKGALAAAFERIEGTEEWGVKLHGIARTGPAPAPGAKSGREYLQRKAATLQRRTPGKTDPELEKFSAALERHSRECVKAAATQPGVEWQASFLVPRAERAAFLAQIGRYAEDWRERYRIECTGPWPPYSFVGTLAATNEGVGTVRKNPALAKSARTGHPQKKNNSKFKIQNSKSAAGEGPKARRSRGRK